MLTRKDSEVTGRIPAGIDLDSLVDVAIGLRQSYKGHVATATKRSLRFCGAQLDPSHGTGAWALQEL